MNQKETAKAAKISQLKSRLLGLEKERMAIEAEIQSLSGNVTPAIRADFESSKKVAAGALPAKDWHVFAGPARHLIPRPEKP